MNIGTLIKINSYGSYSTDLEKGSVGIVTKIETIQHDENRGDILYHVTLDGDDIHYLWDNEFEILSH